MLNSGLLGSGPGQTALSAAARALLVAAALLLLLLPAEAQASETAVGGVTVTSPNPGELVITWDAPGRAPTDYRVTWKKSTAKWPSYKNENTALGGNAFPTERSLTVTDLEEGTAYKVRVRARYFDGNDVLKESGPWSDAVELTVTAAPSEDPQEEEGGSNQGRSTNTPAKPSIVSFGVTHFSVLLLWADPDDDTITGYQVLRGDAKDSLAVLTDDTGDAATTSYTDDSVAAETTYYYAIRARNANGLGEPSDTVTARTHPTPPQPEIAQQVAGANFTLDGEDLDTTGTCDETDIGSISDDCAINIDTTSVVFAVDGTLDNDDRLSIRIGRTLAAANTAGNVFDQSDLRGTDQTVDLTFEVGRNLLRVWGDEDTSSGGSEEHFFRVNVVPYWELSGNRLSKDTACRQATSATAPTAAEITDAACIVTQFDNSAELRFHNVIEAHFNVYVSVNGVEVITTPDDAALGAAFTLDLQAGDDVVRVRLASKGSQPHAETYGSDAFYYKVAASDDATLASLELYDHNILLVWLSPAFSSSVTEYTGTVAEEDSKANEVHAEVNDANATVEFLDKDDMTILTDGKSGKTSYITADLSEEETVFKVKVTAEDGVTTKTYTVTVTIGTPTEFFLAGYLLDRRCTNHAVFSLRCVINIETKAVRFSVDGTLDSDDRVILKTGRNKAEVDEATELASAEYLRGTDQILNIAFPEGKSLLSLLRDDDESPGGEVEYFYSVNVLAYWTLGGQRLYKDIDCQATTAPTADEITDSACINTHVGNTAELRFHNVVSEQYAVHVSVNGTEVITEPDNAALGAAFTVDLQDGDNVVGVSLYRYAASQAAEDFSGGTFYYKVTTDTLVSNHVYGPAVRGDPAYVSYDISTTAHRAQLFRTGSHPRGYNLSRITVEMIQPTYTPASAVKTALPAFAIYDKDSEIAGGHPGRKIVDLNGSVASAGRQTFTPACPTTLAPDTDYYVYFALSYLESGLGLLVKGAGPFEDAVTPGWSIANHGLFKPTGSTTFRVSNPGLGISGVLAIAVSGAAVAESTDASLRNLVLKDTREKTIALDPVLTSCTTDYKATVANPVDTITVEPTLSGANATFKYLNDNGVELMDADSTTDVFDVDLDAGENIFKVEVTAEDSTTKTHTATVTRVDFLVSNADSIVDETTTGVSTTTPKAGISFRTGSNPADVSTVRLNLLIPTGTVPKVSIYSDSSGEPGSSLKALINPGTIPATQSWLDFTAANHRLAANTTYWIVVERESGSGEITIQTTESTDEDAGTATGWSIGDDLLALVSNIWTNILGSRTIPQMVIKGELVKRSDATLSALALTDPSITDPSSNNVPLHPTFASDVASYTATVANAVDRVTVEPTKSDAYATIVYLDSTNAELSDADDNTPKFDFALTEGENVLKVKVTSDDGMANKTYTVTVTFTRVNILVINLGQTVTNYDVIGLHRGNRTLTASAVSFTTGGNAGGYEVSAVRLSVGVVDGATPMVSIYSDSSDRNGPGSSLKVLTNPSTIPSFTQTQYDEDQVVPEERDFGADNFKLDAGTDYWIVIERASVSGGVLFDFTRSTEEDPGTKPGLEHRQRRTGSTKR